MDIWWIKDFMYIILIIGFLVFGLICNMVSTLLVS